MVPHFYSDARPETSPLTPSYGGESTTDPAAVKFDFLRLERRPRRPPVLWLTAKRQCEERFRARWLFSQLFSTRTILETGGWQEQQERRLLAVRCVALLKSACMKSDLPFRTLHVTLLVSSLLFLPAKPRTALVQAQPPLRPVANLSR